MNLKKSVKYQCPLLFYGFSCVFLSSKDYRSGWWLCGKTTLKLYILMEFICINIAQNFPIKWPKCFQKFLFHFQLFFSWNLASANNPWQPIIFEENPVKFWKFRGRTRKRMIEIEQEWHFRLLIRNLNSSAGKRNKLEAILMFFLSAKNRSSSWLW